MSDTNWGNNKIQFPRLIAELEMAGAFTEEVLDGLRASMDLDNAEIFTLVSRAQKEWDIIVRNT